MVNGIGLVSQHGRIDEQLFQQIATSITESYREGTSIDSLQQLLKDTYMTVKKR